MIWHCTLSVRSNTYDGIIFKYIEGRIKVDFSDNCKTVAQKSSAGCSKNAAYFDVNNALNKDER